MGNLAGGAKVPKENSRVDAEQKQPLYARFMDDTLRVTITEEIKAPLQPRTFENGDSASKRQDGKAEKDGS